MVRGVLVPGSQVAEAQGQVHPLSLPEVEPPPEVARGAQVAPLFFFLQMGVQVPGSPPSFF